MGSSAEGSVKGIRRARARGSERLEEASLRRGEATGLPLPTPDNPIEPEEVEEPPSEAEEVA